MTARLALICGTGDLPRHVAERREDVVVCALTGFAPNALNPDLTFRLEHLGSLFEKLRDLHVSEVCFCGGIERPAIDPSQIDAETMPLVPQIMAAMTKGDDAALGIAVKLFEQSDFSIVAAQDIAPDLLPDVGVLTEKQPDATMLADAQKGFAIIEALSPFDTGQACVVGAGQLLAVETLGGTDHMLSTLPNRAQTKFGVVVKAPKLNQDPRVDWPTIGPNTIAAVAAAGLSGLVVQHHGALVLDRQKLISDANAAGLSVWVWSEGS